MQQLHPNTYARNQYTVISLLADTSLKRTPLWSRHVELVPAVLQSFTSSPSKVASYAVVFSVAPQLFPQLRSDTKNGCVWGYLQGGHLSKVDSWSWSLALSALEGVDCTTKLFWGGGGGGGGGERPTGLLQLYIIIVWGKFLVKLNWFWDGVTRSTNKVWETKLGPARMLIIYWSGESGSGEIGKRSKQQHYNKIPKWALNNAECSF